MAVGFPDFKVNSGSLYPYPLGAVRDSINTTYEQRTVSGVRQTRTTLELVYHVQINSWSTISSVLGAYLIRARVDNPVMKVPRKVIGPTGPLTFVGSIRHTGQWDVKDVAIMDEGDGTSTVTTSLQRLLEDWHVQG